MQSGLLFPQIFFPYTHLSTEFSKILTLTAPTGHVDPSNTTTEDATSQTSMKIQSSNFHVKLDVSKYPEELQMLIVALNHYVLSMVMSCLFSVPMTLLSLVGSTLAFNKITKVVMFQLTNEKKYKLTQKHFAQIMKLPVTGPFYEVTIEKVVSTLNEQGHQPRLIVLSHFCKKALPCVRNLLFGIFL